MRFSLTEEQRSFASAIDGVLGSADVAGVCRRWASGDPSGGLRLWGRLAELGVTGLRVPEEFGGTEGTPLDVAVVFERLGYHGVPGPYLESVALAPALPIDAAVLTELAKGTARVSVAAPPQAPYAVDAATATHLYLLTGRTLTAARVDHTVESVDPTRRLALLAPREVIGTVSGPVLDEVVLATAAWLVGAGQRLLDETVGYVTTRRQFGRPIGEFQAVKHALADVRVALDFARPLLHGAAHALGAAAASSEEDVGHPASTAAATRSAGVGRLASIAAAARSADVGRPADTAAARSAGVGALAGRTSRHGGAGLRGTMGAAVWSTDDGTVAGAAGVASREVSAAKVLAAQAAHRAARTALQLHGAVGYTRELDLSRWILRVRALIGAWGTPAYHRARVLDSLVGG